MVCRTFPLISLRLARELIEDSDGRQAIVVMWRIPSGSITCLKSIYLTGFASPSTLVWRYDRADGSCKLLPPRVIGAEKNLYSTKVGDEVSQGIENDWFNRLDGCFGPILRKLEKEDSLSQRDALDLATFVAYLLVRTPAYIRETELRIRQFDTHIHGIGDTIKYGAKGDAPPNARGGDSFLLTKEQFDEVSKVRADTSMRNDVLAMLMTGAVDLSVVLSSLQWSLLSTPVGRSFIVGDNPFAIVPPRSHSTELEGVGPLTSGAVTFVPLSSYLCVRITNSGEPRTLRRRIDGAAVRAINTCQVMNSERYLYGPNETMLGHLTKNISAPCLNPAVVVIREAGSVSDPDTALLHTFTKSKIPPAWADRLPFN
jgi:hypothetical protein